MDLGSGLDLVEMGLLGGGGAEKEGVSKCRFGFIN
jgi:hypothetical protein